MNTKYISSSVLKASEFSRVRSTSENSDVFNSRDEVSLVFAEKKKQILFLFYRLHAMSHPLKRELLKMQKRKYITTLDVFAYE